MGQQDRPAGRPGPGARRPAPGYDEGWARPGAPRGRSAVHDPWRPRRRIGFSGGMPSPPALLGGAMVVLFAFLLGRCTAGDGNDVTTEPTNTTAANPVTTTSQYSVLHVVQENETLAAIAAKYGVTVEAIAIANNIGNTNNIFVGQELKIPPTTPNTTTTTTTKKQGK